jgi:type IV pilus assembly protein PilE
MRPFLGFSLLEILITLAIISILASFCFPLYSQHLTEERRLEAKIALEKLAATLENYYTVHNTYQNANLAQLGFSTFIANNNYKLAIIISAENAFTLTATPLANQAQQDILCKTLTLNSNGVKSISGNGKLSDCWEE